MQQYVALSPGEALYQNVRWRPESDAVYGVKLAHV